ncbi:MAG: hypothetical protein MJ252_22950 [archaeon]|nr:hypothetical protein [archaeon]
MEMDPNNAQNAQGFTASQMSQMSSDSPINEFDQIDSKVYTDERECRVHLEGNFTTENGREFDNHGYDQYGGKYERKLFI